MDDFVRSLEDKNYKTNLVVGIEMGALPLKQTSIVFSNSGSGTQGEVPSQMGHWKDRAYGTPVGGMNPGP